MSDRSSIRSAVGTHDLVWIEGADGVSFADGQLSQDVAAMRPGEVRRSLLLEPKGKLRAILWVLRGEDRVGLATWAGTGGGVAADLERFRFRVDAAVTLAEGVGDSVWGRSEAEAVAGGWSGDPASLRVDLPPGHAPDGLLVGTPLPGGPDLTVAEIALRRVLAGEPVFGVDVDEDTIPQETGLVSEAVSFTKGCYLGQELVARIDTRGHVNRTLRRVTIVGEVPPGGAAVVAGEATVGTLGTVAAVAEGAQALALVRREAMPGDRVTVRWSAGEAAAVIGEITRPPVT
ncbi:MAG: hypothetical protein V1757_05045 [Actinomycetota bacterium]